MSHAILTLGLQLAPATLHRAGNRNVLLWFARCESCGEQTKIHPLMSLALTEHYRHADMHRLQSIEKDSFPVGAVA